MNESRPVEKRIARWESPRGAHWVELYRTDDGCAYRANGAGGFMGRIDDVTALAQMQERVDRGYFLPDMAVVPMKRVA